MLDGRLPELVVIFVLALVILGPDKLPKVVAELGRWLGRARTIARQFREQLEEEVRLEDVRATQRPGPVTPAPAESPHAPENRQPNMDVAAGTNGHTTHTPLDAARLPLRLAQTALQSQEVCSPEATPHAPVQKPPAATQEHESAAQSAAPEHSAGQTVGTPSVQPAAPRQPSPRQITDE